MNMTGNIWTFVSSVFIDSAFPPIFFIFIFALISFKQIKITESFRFILVFFLITLTIRYSQYLSSASNARYLYTLTFPFIIISVFGINKAADLLLRLTQKKIPGVTGIHINVFLICIIVISCAGKALSSPDPKSYIQKIAEIVQKSNKEPVLLFGKTGHEGEPARIAYSSNVSKYYRLSDLIDPDLKNLDYALHYLSNKNLKPYVIVEDTDSEFRDLFKSRNIPFPLKLIKQFHEKHNWICIYELKDD